MSLRPGFTNFTIPCTTLTIHRLYNPLYNIDNSHINNSLPKEAALRMLCSAKHLTTDLGIRCLFGISHLFTATALYANERRSHLSTKLGSFLSVVLQNSRQQDFYIFGNVFVLVDQHRVTRNSAKDVTKRREIWIWRCFVGVVRCANRLVVGWEQTFIKATVVLVIDKFGTTPREEPSKLS